MLRVLCDQVHAIESYHYFSFLSHTHIYVYSLCLIIIIIIIPFPVHSCHCPSPISYLQMIQKHVYTIWQQRISSCFAMKFFPILFKG